jgi:UDP-hydrolysing UDP-N-acetyl-D-glucosamine 2-epimerase
VIEKDGFPVAAKIYSLVDGETHLASAKTTGLGLIETASTFEWLKPDIVVTVADRYETLATAAAAAYMNIPLAHIQGGEITGNIDDKVRDAITMLADYHFPATPAAGDRIEQMGAATDTVFRIGCPSIDLVCPILEETGRRLDPSILRLGVGAQLDLDRPYLVVLQHPVTTESQDSADNIAETLHAVREIGMPTFWFWPNPDAGSSDTAQRIRIFRENNLVPNIRFIKNLEPANFLRLLKCSGCLVGNSSAGIRECSYLGVAVVNIGNRQAGRQRGPNVVDVGYCRNEITRAVRYQLNHGPYPSDHLYGDGHSGRRIAKILATLQLRQDRKAKLSPAA